MKRRRVRSVRSGYGARVGREPATCNQPHHYLRYLIGTYTYTTEVISIIIFIETKR